MPVVIYVIISMPQNQTMFQSEVFSKVVKSLVGSSRLCIPMARQNKF